MITRVRERTLKKITMEFLFFRPSGGIGGVYRCAGFFFRAPLDALEIFFVVLESDSSCGKRESVRKKFTAIPSMIEFIRDYPGGVAVLR